MPIHLYNVLQSNLVFLSLGVLLKTRRPVAACGQYGGLCSLPMTDFFNWSGALKQCQYTYIMYCNQIRCFCPLEFCKKTRRPVEECGQYMVDYNYVACQSPVF